MKRPLPSFEESVRILRTTHTKRAPRPAPPVQKQVQPLLKSLEEKFAASDDGSGRLKDRWPEIVGAELSRLCEPVRIIKGRGGPKGVHQGGTLEIRTAGSYAPLIQHQSAALLERLNLFLGAGAIARLRIVQGPLTLPARKHAPPRPQPLSATDELRLLETVADVGDARLKNALLRLGRAVVKRSRLPPS